MKVPTYCRICGGAMLAESDVSDPKCNDCKKMDVLMGLNIPSIVQINESTAMLKLPHMWECMITVSSPSYEWVAKSKDVVYDWQSSPSVPDDVKEGIGKVAKMYNDALIEFSEMEG